MIETDALIVGAGPVGLFQVFQLGLLEIDAHVVDSLPYPGGQCIELYPDKPIYDIPGVLRYTGRELVANLLKQIEPFKPTFHLGQEVSRVERQPDGRFAVETSKGIRFLAKTIVIAGGVGAFQPKLLKIEGIERFVGSQLFYSADDAAAANTSGGRHLLVIGGDEIALDAVGRFAATGQGKVTLLHRREVLQASPDGLADFKALCDSGAAEFVVGQVTGFEERDGRLVAAQVTDTEGQTRPLTLDAMLVLLGISPRLGAIANWGISMERKQLQVDTEKFATSEPGIFAVGDINTYPGKKKLILSGFHEAALAAFGAAAVVFPEKKIMLQYTTTSPRLHQLLGVAPEPARD